MVNPTSESSVNKSKLSEIVKEIKKKGKLFGIILSYRDGTLIVKYVDDEIWFEKTIPLLASILKSAEDIRETIGQKKINKIIAQLNKKNILILKSEKDNIFLTMIIDEKSDPEILLNNIELYLVEIEKNLKKINNYRSSTNST